MNFECIQQFRDILSYKAEVFSLIKWRLWYYAAISILSSLQAILPFLSHSLHLVLQKRRFFRCFSARRMTLAHLKAFHIAVLISIPVLWIYSCSQTL